VSAVISGLPVVIVVAFIRLPARFDILQKGSSRRPRLRVVEGSLAHSGEGGKDNHAARQYPPDALLPQKSHGQMSSRPVVSKSGKLRVAKRPSLMRAMAAIIPSGAVMGRPWRRAALMMSP